jgi:two-component SAPR family response regulator
VPEGQDGSNTGNCDARRTVQAGDVLEFGVQSRSEPKHLRASTARRTVVGIQDLESLRQAVFHQVRDDLKKSVPGLSIPYDRQQRTYGVRLEQVDFSWDHRDLRAALTRVETQGTDLLEVLSGYTGVFLPHAEGPWASREREQLQAWVIRVGLKTLTEWQVAQDCGRCLRLARRLVELDPDDEALNVVLLRAVQEVEGDLAARTAYRAIRRRFEEDYGEVPPSLAQLGEALQMLKGEPQDGG